jgi:hypothetical protein
MHNWIKFNEKGKMICVVCAYAVIQVGYLFYCTNRECLHHEPDIIEKQYQNESRNFISTALNSNVSLSQGTASPSFSADGDLDT